MTRPAESPPRSVVPSGCHPTQETRLSVDVAHNSRLASAAHTRTLWSRPAMARRSPVGDHASPNATPDAPSTVATKSSSTLPTLLNVSDHVASQPGGIGEQRQGPASTRSRASMSPTAATIDHLTRPTRRERAGARLDSRTTDGLVGTSQPRANWGVVPVTTVPKMRLMCAAQSLTR